MSLIVCPECGKTVSNQASVCINCGYPVNTESRQNTNVQTIEATGKIFKAAEVVGWVVLLFGFAIYGATPEGSTGGALIAGTGSFLLLYGMIGKWWHHS